jgi:DNA-binding PadR family transcriptional regulator
MVASDALLGLLESTSSHGYDLKLAYDKRFAGAKPLRFGHVYRLLAQLARDGLVAAKGVEPARSPSPRTTCSSR